MSFDVIKFILDEIKRANVPGISKTFLSIYGFRLMINKVKNKDFGILITGERGLGKSTLAFKLYEVANEILERHPVLPIGRLKTEAYFVGPTWSQFVAYLIKVRNILKDKTTKELEKEMYFFIFDEARLMFEKRRAMSHQNVILSQLFTVIRPLQAVHFFIAPRIDDIDKDMRDPDKSNWFLYLYKRGRGVGWLDYHTNRKSTTSYLFSRWKWLIDNLKITGNQFMRLIKFGIPYYDSFGNLKYYKPLKPAIEFEFSLPYPKLKFWFFNGKKWIKVPFESYEEYRKQLVPNTIDNILDMLAGKKNELESIDQKMDRLTTASIRLMKQIRELQKKKEEIENILNSPLLGSMSIDEIQELKEMKDHIDMMLDVLREKYRETIRQLKILLNIMKSNDDKEFVKYMVEIDQYLKEELKS